MGWDWNQITAVATVLGVIGGLISLIFLIYEVRHNAHAIEGATVQSLMSLECDVFALIGENADLYLRGGADLASLSAAERLKFDRIVGAQMSLYYSAYVQLQQALIDDEIWDAYHNAVRDGLDRPGFSECWRAMAPRYPLSFREMIAPRAAG